LTDIVRRRFVREGQPIAILTVDDEPGVLALVRRCLDDQRITLIEASSGKAALEQMSTGRRPVDLLLTDLWMPDMEGDELARQLRVLEPCLRVLYLTSHVDKLFEAKPQLWADEVYLDKPFTREGLREAVALLLFGRKDALTWQ
jgi:CheY-like chemotaxis protein